MLLAYYIRGRLVKMEPEEVAHDYLVEHGLADE